MLGSGLNLVTTLIGFGMSATFIVFVCARLICGRAARADVDDAGAVAASRVMAQPPAPFDFDVEFRAADLDRTVRALIYVLLYYSRDVLTLRITKKRTDAPGQRNVPLI
jgi:hypothetical protein